MHVRPRQVDIARLAGVSQTTVALVLNGSESAATISPEKQARVREIARRLGYVPDPVARRLVAKRNKLIGVYTFTATFPVDLSHSYYPFLSGIEEEAAAQMHDLILFTGSTGDDPGHAAVLARMPIADGCVLLGRRFPVDGIDRLMSQDFPLVYLGRHEELGSELPYVGFDYVSGARVVIQRLVELGHRRLLYLTEADGTPPSLDRERGVREVLARSGIDAGETIVVTDGSDLTPERLTGWLGEGVTAIACETTDTMQAAQALLQASNAARLHWPASYSLAMLGDFGVNLPPLPTPLGFLVDRREAGRRAVRLLLRQLHGDPLPRGERQLLLPCPLIEGETAGPPAPTAKRRTKKR